MKKLRDILSLLALGVVFFASAACGATTNTKQADKHWSEWDSVKVAAAQVSIHTGTEGDEIVDYIDRAGKDNVQLLVLGEYILGKFPSNSFDEGVPLENVRSRVVQLEISQYEPNAPNEILEAELEYVDVGARS